MSKKRKVSVGDVFTRLTVIEKTDKRVNGRVVWRCRCECEEEIDVPTSYLTSGDTKSCGCLKKEQETNNLREQYDAKRVDDVAKHLFKGEEPRKDSTTGYRGVSKYFTRTTKELRYRAWITVKGKRYYKAGFKTAEEAYQKGRLYLENKYLPEGQQDEQKGD